MFDQEASPKSVWRPRESPADKTAALKSAGEYGGDFFGRCPFLVVFKDRLRGHPLFCGSSNKKTPQPYVESRGPRFN